MHCARPSKYTSASRHRPAIFKMFEKLLFESLKPGWALARAPPVHERVVLDVATAAPLFIPKTHRQRTT